MYDIPELEKKWRKYKRKKIQKPIVIIGTVSAVVIGITIASFTYLNSAKYTKNNKLASNTDKNVSVKVNRKNKNQNKLNTKTTQNSDKAIVITKIDSNSNSLVDIKPSNSSVNAADTQSANSIDISKAEIIKPNVPDDEIRVIGFDKKEKNKIKKKYEDILIPSKSKQNMQFREKIAELEERFKSYQDPKDSLKLAKLYYKNGNYKKAESWAVSTNNIDGDIEESWLIFAKARAKQGFRKDAIKVLQSYYDETNSAKAKNLLVKIRFGKTFK